MLRLQDKDEENRQSTALSSAVPWALGQNFQSVKTFHNGLSLKTLHVSICHHFSTTSVVLVFSFCLLLIHLNLAAFSLNVALFFSLFPFMLMKFLQLRLWRSWSGLNVLQKIVEWCLLMWKKQASRPANDPRAQSLEIWSSWHLCEMEGKIQQHPFME